MSVEGIKTSGFSKQKLRGFYKQWQEAEAEYLSANGAAMKKKKDAMNDVREAVDQIGIKKSVWNKVMETTKLRKKALKVRDGIEGEQVDQFDVVCLALGIPLFDEEQGQAEEAGKKSEPDPEQEKIAAQKERDAKDFDEGTSARPH